MMFQKAVFFEYPNACANEIQRIIADAEKMMSELGLTSHNILYRILHASTPKQAKALGKEVKNFNKPRWEAIVAKILFRGNQLKFEQNPALLNQFLSFKTQRFVEASPFDRIYGIGLAHSHPDAPFPAKWRGQNILGDVLTQLRDYFLSAKIDDIICICPACSQETLANNGAQWQNEQLICNFCGLANPYDNFTLKPS